MTYKIGLREYYTLSVEKNYFQVCFNLILTKNL